MSSDPYSDPAAFLCIDGKHAGMNYDSLRAKVVGWFEQAAGGLFAPALGEAAVFRKANPDAAFNHPRSTQAELFVRPESGPEFKSRDQEGGWQFFLGLVRELPEQAMLEVVYWNEQGRPVSRAGVEMNRIGRFSIHLSIHTDPAILGEDEKDELLSECLRNYAEETDPTFGQIAKLEGHIATSFERSFGLFPEQTLGLSRMLLRGYSWLTIISAEQGSYLGGVDALRATGAFAEVAQLRKGGYWLRACKSPADWDLAHAERVFEALAPIMPPGKPRWPEHRSNIVVDRDPRLVPWAGVF